MFKDEQIIAASLQYDYYVYVFSYYSSYIYIYVLHYVIYIYIYICIFMYYAQVCLKHTNILGPQ